MRLGIVEPASQTTAQTSSPADRVVTAGRFEIKDSDGNFIPGASVTLTMDNGEFLLNKLSDAGGNVPVTPDDVQTASKHLKTIPIGRTWKIMYSVSAPGTNTKSGLFLDGSKPTVDQLTIHSVTLYRPDDIRAYYPHIAIGAGALALGTILWYVLRKK